MESFTNVLKRLVYRRIYNNGGVIIGIEDSFVEGATHIVATHEQQALVQEARQAQARGVDLRIVGPQWVLACVDAGEQLLDSPEDPGRWGLFPEPHVPGLPGFRDMTRHIRVSGFPADKKDMRTLLLHWVECMGGLSANETHAGDTSHVLTWNAGVLSPSQLEMQQRWPHIRHVHFRWLFFCRATWSLVDDEPFLLRPPDEYYQLTQATGDPAEGGGHEIRQLQEQQEPHEHHQHHQQQHQHLRQSQPGHVPAEEEGAAALRPEEEPPTRQQQQDQQQDQHQRQQQDQEEEELQELRAANLHDAFRQASCPMADAGSTAAMQQQPLPRSHLLATGTGPDGGDPHGRCRQDSPVLGRQLAGLVKAEPQSRQPSPMLQQPHPALTRQQQHLPSPLLHSHPHPQVPAVRSPHDDSAIPHPQPGMPLPGPDQHPLAERSELQLQPRASEVPPEGPSSSTWTLSSSEAGEAGGVLAGPPGQSGVLPRVKREPEEGGLGLEPEGHGGWSAAQLGSGGRAPPEGVQHGQGWGQQHREEHQRRQRQQQQQDNHHDHHDHHVHHQRSVREDGLGCSLSCQQDGFAAPEVARDGSAAGSVAPGWEPSPSLDQMLTDQLAPPQCHHGAEGKCRGQQRSPRLPPGRVKQEAWEQGSLGPGPCGSMACAYGAGGGTRAPSPGLEASGRPVQALPGAASPHARPQDQQPGEQDYKQQHEQEQHLRRSSGHGRDSGPIAAFRAPLEPLQLGQNQQPAPLRPLLPSQDLDQHAAPQKLRSGPQPLGPRSLGTPYQGANEEAEEEQGEPGSCDGATYAPGCGGRAGDGGAVAAGAHVRQEEEAEEEAAAGEFVEGDLGSAAPMVLDDVPGDNVLEDDEGMDGCHEGDGGEAAGPGGGGAEAAEAGEEVDAVAAAGPLAGSAASDGPGSQTFERARARLSALLPSLVGSSDDSHASAAPGKGPYSLLLRQPPPSQQPPPLLASSFPASCKGPGPDAADGGGVGRTRSSDATAAAPAAAAAACQAVGDPGADGAMGEAPPEEEKQRQRAATGPAAATAAAAPAARRGAAAAVLGAGGKRGRFRVVQPTVPAPLKAQPDAAAAAAALAAAAAAAAAEDSFPAAYPADEEDAKGAAGAGKRPGSVGDGGKGKHTDDLRQVQRQGRKRPATQPEPPRRRRLATKQQEPDDVDVDAGQQQEGHAAPPCSGGGGGDAAGAAGTSGNVRNGGPAVEEGVEGPGGELECAGGAAGEERRPDGPMRDEQLRDGRGPGVADPHPPSVNLGRRRRRGTQLDSKRGGDGGPVSAGALAALESVGVVAGRKGDEGDGDGEDLGAAAARVGRQAQPADAGAGDTGDEGVSAAADPGPTDAEPGKGIGNAGGEAAAAAPGRGRRKASGTGQGAAAEAVAVKPPRRKRPAEESGPAQEAAANDAGGDPPAGTGRAQDGEGPGAPPDRAALKQRRRRGTAPPSASAAEVAPAEGVAVRTTTSAGAAEGPEGRQAPPHSSSPAGPPDAGHHVPLEAPVVGQDGDDLAGGGDPMDADVHQVAEGDPGGGNHSDDGGKDADHGPGGTEEYAAVGAEARRKEQPPGAETAPAGRSAAHGTGQEEAAAAPPPKDAAAAAGQNGGPRVARAGSVRRGKAAAQKGSGRAEPPQEGGGAPDADRQAGEPAQGQQEEEQQQRLKQGLEQRSTQQDEAQLAGAKRGGKGRKTGAKSMAAAAAAAVAAGAADDQPASGAEGAEGPPVAVAADAPVGQERRRGSGGDAVAVGSRRGSGGAAALGPNATAAAAAAKMVFALSGFSSDDRTRYGSMLKALRLTYIPVNSDWDPRINALLAPSLKRSDKTVCAMACGAWLLRADYLAACQRAAAAAGVGGAAGGGAGVDPAAFELEKCEEGPSVIATGAPAHWRRRCAARGPAGRAFAGLRLLVPAGLPSPLDSATLVRMVTAGGGVAVVKGGVAAAKGCHAGVVPPGCKQEDKLVAALRAAGAAVVAPAFVVDWVVHPHAALAQHYRHGTEAGPELAALEQDRGKL